MALADPTQLGYQAAVAPFASFDEALQSISKQYAERKKTEQEQARGLEFLKQFGLLKEEPTTFEDYQTAVGRGREIITRPGATEEEKLGVAQQFFGALGIPEPEPRFTLDPEKAKIALKGLFPGIDITAKEEKLGGYDRPENVPKIQAGEPIKKLEQDPDTGKWFAEYGPKTLTPYEQAMEAIRQSGGGGKDQFGYTIGEKQRGHIYIGNNQWQKQ